MIRGGFPGPLRVPFQRPLISNLGFHSHCGQRPSPHLGLWIQHVHRHSSFPSRPCRQASVPNETPHLLPGNLLLSLFPSPLLAATPFPPNSQARYWGTILATPFLTLFTSHRPPSPVNPSFCSPRLFSCPSHLQLHLLLSGLPDASLNPPLTHLLPAIRADLLAPESDGVTTV